MAFRTVKGVVNKKLKIQALFNFCADDLMKLLGLFIKAFSI